MLLRHGIPTILLWTDERTIERTNTSNIVCMTCLFGSFLKCFHPLLCSVVLALTLTAQKALGNITTGILPPHIQHQDARQTNEHYWFRWGLMPQLLTPSLQITFFVGLVASIWHTGWGNAESKLRTGSKTKLEYPVDTDAVHSWRNTVKDSWQRARKRREAANTAAASTEPEVTIRCSSVQGLPLDFLVVTKFTNRTLPSKHLNLYFCFTIMVYFLSF